MKLLKWLIIAAVILAVLRAVWPWIVLGVVAFLIIRVVQARNARLEALRARCDQQHALVMAGDPAGTFGEFPVPGWALPRREQTVPAGGPVESGLFGGV